MTQPPGTTGIGVSAAGPAPQQRKRDNAHHQVRHPGVHGQVQRGRRPQQIIHLLRRGTVKLRHEHTHDEHHRQGTQHTEQLKHRKHQGSPAVTLQVLQQKKHVHARDKHNAQSGHQCRVILLDLLHSLRLTLGEGINGVLHCEKNIAGQHLPHHHLAGDECRSKVHGDQRCRALRGK